MSPAKLVHQEDSLVGQFFYRRSTEGH